MNSADRDHDQQRSAVERDLRPRRPRLDVLAPVPPEQVDEERDREEERDLGDQHRARRASTYEVEHDDDERDQRDDQEAAQRRVHSGEAASGRRVGAHRERRGDERRAREPREPLRGSFGA